jgi:hypothetical protein
VYQAGVLRALTEAGVKIDLLAAHGAGVMTAMCGAIDGGGRLWDAAGPWSAASLKRAYRWRRSLRVAGWALAAALVVVLSPLVLLIGAGIVYGLALLASLVGLPGVGEWLMGAYRTGFELLFHPPLIPTIVPRLVVLAAFVVAGVLAAAAIRAARSDRTRRRWRGSFWWRLVGSPLEADEPETTLLFALWRLVRGASTEPQPPPAEVGRRYVEILAENLDQPGFRELIVAVHDLDARRDLVGCVLPAASRDAFGGRRLGGGPREAEVVDFAGPAGTLVVDFLKAALRQPVVAPPQVCQFPEETFWRGEAHRLCDRPELVVRLVEEIATAGVEQVILIGAAAPPSVPHALREAPLALRARVGEVLRSIETSAMQDAWQLAATRFSGVFVIRPDHNPIGPFDFDGAYDRASDRVRRLDELMKQGYDDAYRQFIEPIAAAGERVAVV